MIPTIIILIWLTCGVTAAGFLLADLQGRFPTVAQKDYREDLGMALFFSVFGPLTLFISFFITGFAEYGWTLRRPR